MSTVTLETLRADFDDTDFAIVDLIERLRHGFVRFGPQTDEFHQDISELLAALNSRPVPLSVALLYYTLGTLRLTFDPIKVVGWNEHSDRCQNYLLETDDDFNGNGLHWMQQATLALIAVRYGLNAAMLYKLSDGAIDPRKVGDA